MNRERLVKLAQWVDQNNNIKILINRTFSLDQAGKAPDYQKDIHPRGKVVLPCKEWRRQFIIADRGQLF